MSLPVQAPHELTLSDELEPHCSLRALQKVRGCAFHPAGAGVGTTGSGDKGKGGDRVLLSLASNLLEVYKVPSPASVAVLGPGTVAGSVAVADGKKSKKSKKDKDGEGKKRSGSVGSAADGDDDAEEGGGDEAEGEGDDGPLSLSAAVAGPVAVAKQSVLELAGHRSDVRAVCLSADGSLAATCASDGVKVWSTRSHLCLRSCPTGYGVSVAFAPGARYVITGTKDGRVQVADSASGAVVVDRLAHTGAVWSLCVRPDGRGFASASADKDVKFWDFTVEEGGVLGVALARQLGMAQDALCVRYSPTKSQDKLMVAVGLLDCTIKVRQRESERERGGCWLHFKSRCWRDQMTLLY